MIWKRTTLVMLGMLVGYIARPVASPAQEGAASPQEAAVNGPVRIEMTVLGMSCPFCAYGLEKKLRTIEGAESVEADYESGRVTLTVRDGSKVSDERVRELVKDAGFEVEGEIRRTSPEESPTADDQASG